MSATDTRPSLTLKRHFAAPREAVFAAWTDPEVNRATRNFFADTLATLQGSYLRPTRPGFLPFFRECTHKAVAAIRGEIPAGELADWLNARHAATSGALDGSPA